MRLWVRYLLYQIPGFAALVVILVVLSRTMGLGFWPALIIVAAWVIKDTLLYPFVRDAYRPGGVNPSERLVGRVGVVEERLGPEGFVRIGSELWRAEVESSDHVLEPGARVRVVAVSGLTVRVEDLRES